MAFTTQYLASSLGQNEQDFYDSSTIQKTIETQDIFNSTDAKQYQLPYFSKLNELALLFKIDMITLPDFLITKDISTYTQDTFAMLPNITSIKIKINNIELDPYLINPSDKYEQYRYIQFKNHTAQEIKQFISQYGLPYIKKVVSNDCSQRKFDSSNNLFPISGITDNKNIYAKEYNSQNSKYVALNDNYIILPLKYIYPILDNDNYLPMGTNFLINLAASLTIQIDQSELFQDSERKYKITQIQFLYSQYIFNEEASHKLISQYASTIPIFYPFLQKADYVATKITGTSEYTNTVALLKNNYYDIDILYKGTDFPTRLFISPQTTTDFAWPSGPAGENIKTYPELPYFFKMIELKNIIEPNIKEDIIYRMESPITPLEILRNRLFNTSCEEMHRRLTLSSQNNTIKYYENEENCLYNVKPYMIDLRNILDSKTFTAMQTQPLFLKLRIEAYLFETKQSDIATVPIPIMNTTNIETYIRIYSEYQGRAQLTEKGLSTVPNANPTLTY